MKTKAMFLVILLAIGLALPIAVRADSVPSIPLVPAVTVDGSESDVAWQCQEWCELAIPADLMLGDEEILGNCGLKLKLGHDDVNLYILAEISDDAIVATPWQEWVDSDALVIGWSATGKHTTVNATDRLIIVKPSSTDNMRVVNVLSGALNAVGASNVTITATSWKVECSVPLSALEVPTVGVKPAFVASYWDIDPTVVGPSVISNYQNGAMVVDGPIAFGEVEYSTEPVYKVVSGEDLKQTPNSVLFQSQAISWTVTKTGDGFAYCQNPDSDKRLQAVKVVSPLTATLAQGDQICHLSGQLQTVGGERVLQATDIDSMSGGGYYKFTQPAPFYIGSLSLGGASFGSGPPNLALLVRVVGWIRQIGDGYFIITEGGRDIYVEGECAFGVGVPVIVTGVSSSSGISAVVLATKVEEVIQ